MLALCRLLWCLNIWAANTGLLANAQLVPNQNRKCFAYRWEHECLWYYANFLEDSHYGKKPSLALQENFLAAVRPPTHWQRSHKNTLAVIEQSIIVHTIATRESDRVHCLLHLSTFAFHAHSLFQHHSCQVSSWGRWTFCFKLPILPKPQSGICPQGMYFFQGKKKP